MDCHEFKSIQDITNFRYRPAWLSSWKYPKDTDKSPLLEIPRAFKLFRKYRLHTGETLDGEGEKDVFCHPGSVGDLNAEELGLELESNETLVVAGADLHVSRNIEKLLYLKKYFKHIYCEAKNIEVDFIDTIPMGTNLAYLLRCGSDKSLQIINKSNHNKTNLIACAFNSKWDIRNYDRRGLQKFCRRSKFLKRHTWKPTEYFDNLSRFKFFSCPLGNGIQTPKICESILTETIPVVIKHPAHIDLYEHGVPMLMVDSWKDLNEDMLSSFYEDDEIDWISARNIYRVDCIREHFLD